MAEEIILNRARKWAALISNDEASVSVFSSDAEARARVGAEASPLCDNIRESQDADELGAGRRHERPPCGR